MKKIQNSMVSFFLLLRTFIVARKGLAAIEFALVFPVFILLHLATVEICALIEMNRNVHRIAESYSDMLAKKIGSITKEELQSFLEISLINLQKYNKTVPRFTLTTHFQGKEHPSFKNWYFHFPPTATHKKPDKIITNNPSFLIRVEITLDYKTGVSNLLKEISIPIKVLIYMRSKGTGSPIYCKDCDHL